jgi:hypothetical protein
VSDAIREADRAYTAEELLTAALGRLSDEEEN